MTVEIIVGDMRERLRGIAADSIDSVVCDPPYHLTSIVKRFGAANAAPAKVGATGAYERASRGFMGQQWDGGDVAFQPETWAEVLRVLKPGAHLVAFSGTRTYHRMVCAIEDAGFEIRDQLAWVYGSGFPKSHDVSKQIDRMAGAARLQVAASGGLHKNRLLNDDGWAKVGSDGATMDGAEPITPEAAEWQGWGTALKPAWEPICLARVPLVGTVAANVLKHGTGALNIDGCRIETGDDLNGGAYCDNREISTNDVYGEYRRLKPDQFSQPLGRWPPNLAHDGSEEVLAGFPNEPGSGSGEQKISAGRGMGFFNEGQAKHNEGIRDFGDSGSAARFFYCAKADASERHIGGENSHPTVKPLDLMRWLVTLVTPPGGTVLDPFCGSGSTLIAADRAQFNAIGIELSPEYAEIARKRLSGDRGGLLDAMEAA